MTSLRPSFSAGKQPGRPWLRSDGRWCIKRRGKVYYLGRDEQAALAEWDRIRPYVETGRPVPDDGTGDGPTVADVCDAYLQHKAAQIARGERSPRYLKDCRYTTDRIVKVFGKETPVAILGPVDFAKLAAEMAKTLGPAARRTEIAKTKSVFRFALEYDLIDRVPKYGPDFRPPSEKVVQQVRQQARAENGLRLFTAEEIRAVLDSAAPELRCMVLLGVNCGFGNHDCGSLPLSALDLENGWIEYPRPKTGAPRRIPLWPETVEALRRVLKRRRPPKDPKHRNLVFLTRRAAQPYCGMTPGGHWVEQINGCLDVHLKQLGIKRPGLSFYALRHTTETIGGESRDQAAVDAIMGHVDRTMARHYRERISDDRLRAVAEHVRSWLFGGQETK